MSIASQVPLGEFAEKCRDQTIPLSNLFSYFCVSRIEEETLHHLLHEPVAATPPALNKLFRSIRVILVPYLETLPSPKVSKKSSNAPAKSVSKVLLRQAVSFVRPSKPHRIYWCALWYKNEAFLFLATDEKESVDLHHNFYNGVSKLVYETLTEDVVAEFLNLLCGELAGSDHGEIDEHSWRLKENLIRRQNDPTRNTKLLQKYACQSMQDTLTLYMHGLCCDIGLETGPRQLSSQNVRRRLNLLRQILPPPSGVALFPEELAAVQGAPPKKTTSGCDEPTT